MNTLVRAMAYATAYMEWLEAGQFGASPLPSDYGISEEDAVMVRRVVWQHRPRMKLAGKP